MKDFTFEDGKKVTIDVSKMSWNEWRDLWSGTLKDEDAVMAKVLGVSKEELIELYNYPQPEIRRLNRAVLMAGREPITDPNSASGSTSE
jgi:putative sterol carrier protein